VEALGALAACVELVAGLELVEPVAGEAAVAGEALGVEVDAAIDAEVCLRAGSRRPA
jgi:hypothetical protein